MKTIRTLLSLLLALAVMLVCAAALAEDDDFDAPFTEADLEFLFSQPYGEAIPMEIGEVDTSRPLDMLEMTMDPFIPEELMPDERNILGTDNRVTITNNRQYPYSAIAYIVATGTDGCQWTASGFMVNKKSFVTAAHCLYCKHAAPIKGATFYFGFRNKSNYLRKYDGAFSYWTGTNMVGGYTDDAMNRDYAYLLFKADVGSHTGWFGMTADNDSTLRNTAYSLTAYRDGVLTQNWGTMSPVSANVASFTMDSLPGNSGGPIYNPDYYVAAIVSGHSNDGQYNWAYRLQGWLFTQMHNNNLW